MKGKIESLGLVSILNRRLSKVNCYVRWVWFSRIFHFLVLRASFKVLICRKIYFSFCFLEQFGRCVLILRLFIIIITCDRGSLFSSTIFSWLIHSDWSLEQPIVSNRVSSGSSRWLPSIRVYVNFPQIWGRL